MPGHIFRRPPGHREPRTPDASRRKPLLHALEGLAGLGAFALGAILAVDALNGPQPSYLEAITACLLLCGAGPLLIQAGPEMDRANDSVGDHPGCKSALTGLAGSASVGSGVALAVGLFVDNVWACAVAGIVVFVAVWIWSWTRTSLADD